MPKDRQNQQAEEQTDTEKKLLFLPYIKGVSVKIERICYLLQVTPIFKSMNTRRQSTDEGEVKQTGKMKVWSMRSLVHPYTSARLVVHCK